MAIDQIIKALSNKTDILGEITQTGAGASPYTQLPSGIDDCAVELAPTGTASIEFTTDRELAEAGGAGVTWPEGEVTERTQLALVIGGYLRVVNVDGDSKVIIRGSLN